MLSQFEFVITDPSVSLKPGKSSIVRSRCMQGKNKRDGSRRSQRDKKRQHATYHKTAVVDEYSMKERVPPSLNAFALVRFASQVDPEAQGLLLKAFASNVATEAMYPLDRCVDFDCIESQAFQWLFTDASFLHSVLCASYAINELVVPTWNGQIGRKVLLHLRETLALLAKKMDGESAHEDEAVLYVVINLALLATVYGDWTAAASHFAGLHRIVKLRGGLKFLRTRPKVHFKLDRLDLAWSLSSGKKPFFLNEVESWESVIKTPQTRLNLYRPPAKWVMRLASVFRDFQHLAITINENVREHARYNATCFQNILSSLQSRLMHLADKLKDSTEQLISLTLLAFLTTTFKVPGRKIPYTWVAKQLHTAYGQARDGILRSDTSLRIWVLMVAAISVVDLDKPWLVKAWRVGQFVTSWDEAKKQLTSVMWIECIHDNPGRIALEYLNSRVITKDKEVSLLNNSM